MLTRILRKDARATIDRCRYGSYAECMSGFRRPAPELEEEVVISQTAWMISRRARSGQRETAG